MTDVPHESVLAGVLGQGEGREAPLHTFTRQNAERGAGPYARREFPTSLVASILAVAVAMVVLAWWINRSSGRSRPAAERAFDRLSRRLRLGRAGRSLLEEIARATDHDPLALLVSPGAMGEALKHPESASWRARPGWGRVRALAG